MSLINKALKQEQMRRNGHPSAAAPMGMPAAGFSRPRNDNRNMMVLVTFVVFGALFLASVAVFIFFGSRHLAETGHAKDTEIAPQVVLQPAVQVEAAEEASPAEIEPAAIVEPEPPVEETIEATVAKAPEPTYNPETQVFIETLPIQGARSAGANSRLLANGKVYRAGSIIEPVSGLRFKGIKNGFILFQDSSGYVYERSQ